MRVGASRQELLEVVPGGVVEGITRSLAQQLVRVLEPLGLHLGVGPEHLHFCGGENAVEAPKDGERQDDVLILAAFEGISDQIGDTPYERNDLTVVHVP